MHPGSGVMGCGTTAGRRRERASSSSAAAAHVVTVERGEHDDGDAGGADLGLEAAVLVEVTVGRDDVRGVTNAVEIFKEIVGVVGIKVKVLEVTVGNINDQLSKSGVLLKSAELESIKTNIDSLKILIEAQYESMKEIHESQSKTLDYIH